MQTATKSISWQWTFLNWKIENTLNFHLLVSAQSFGKIINFEKRPEDLEKKYSEALSDSIKNFWSDENQNKLKLQSKTINATYSWDVRSVEWKNFFDKARKLKV